MLPTQRIAQLSSTRGRLARMWLVCLVLGIACAAPAPAAFAQVLDYVEADDSAFERQVLVHFLVPMQYLAHAPANRGAEVAVQLRPLAQRRGAEVLPEESLSWNATSDLPLTGVSFRRSADGSGELVARFDQTVAYRITMSPSARVLVIALPAPDAAARALEAAMTEYALNLRSSLAPIALDGLPRHELLTRYPPYVTQREVEGQLWYRLRIGPFATRTEVEDALRAVSGVFPGAWIAPYERGEREPQTAPAPRPAAVPPSGARVPTPAAPRAATPSTAPGERPAQDLELDTTRITENADLQPRVTFPVEPPAGQSREVLEELVRRGRSEQATREIEEEFANVMEEARQGFAAGDFDRAIQLYTNVIEGPPSPYRQDALEFLGTARERNGQLAHATEGYERYLAEYPEGEGADRVRQRLQALLTAALPGNPKLRVSSTRADGVRWSVFGGASQFYRSNEIFFDEDIDGDGREEEEDLVNLSGLFSNVDLAVQRRGEELDVRARVTGTHFKSFLDEESTIDSMRLLAAYVDVAGVSRDFAGRLGRQTRSTGGVLGRFDGLSVDYRLSEKTELNFVTGQPVELSSRATQSNRSFYGLSASLGTFAGAWDVIPFFIAQTVDGIQDRQAVGVETRFFNEKGSILSVVDYDLGYGDLNNLLVIGNRNAGKFTLNAILDVRNSPVLTTNNALVSQPVRTIEELLTLYTEDEVRGIALDRTLDSHALALGFSRPISEKLDIAADITVTRVSEMPGSAGVEPFPASDDEVYYNLQFTGSSLFKEGDLHLFALRYSDATTTSGASFLLNTRYPVGTAWNVNPRLRLDQRVSNIGDTSQSFVSPSIRVEYSPRRNFRVDLEAGWQWADVETLLGMNETSGFFLNLGYVATF